MFHCLCGNNNKAENDLTGSIPTEIGDLTELTMLDLCKWLYCLDFFGILVVALYEL